MTILKILQYPDSRLKRKGKPVEITEIKSQQLQKIIDDMLETLAHTKGCFGLAATQLDIEDPPSVTVMNNVNHPNEVLCLLNPQIVEHRGEQFKLEGCMSVYPESVSCMIHRSEYVKVSALTRDGHTIEISADGLLAKGLQHEIDHLHGILYLDKLSPFRRSMLEKKIRKLLKIKPQHRI